MDIFFYNMKNGAIGNPNCVKIPEKNISVSSKSGDSVSFGYKDMHLYTLVGFGGHGDMWDEHDIPEENDFDDGMFLTGRFWINTELITFWDEQIQKPWLEKLKNDLKNDYGFDITKYYVATELYSKNSLAIISFNDFIKLAPNFRESIENIYNIQQSRKKYISNTTPKSLEPFKGSQLSPRLEKELSMPAMENKIRKIIHEELKRANLVI